ncbi:protein XRP2 [Eurytemora carolleeae]|uniref:protein XRP2 n=1 Tax=Eurytemora carolleeae TaxID=1294199 RepID=UPI000C7604C9|nr:protein XRP2 [Eurytemora carolleeae]|eukprot:XP_023322127.1 protein XRP2-like [Eurytemora affinis]
MGCNISGVCSRSSSEDIDETDKPPERKQYSWDLKTESDLSKYIIDSKGEGEVFRGPGSINGQQFQIKNCVRSQIYLYDWSNTITIDDCKHCKIFLGPVKGSVFVRDCTDCTIVLACGQFRTRDCSNLDVFILVNTQPIIESSTGIRLGCFQFYYDQLSEHMFQADISPWQNFWWKVHDFTPVKGEKNWSKLGTIFKVEDYLPLPTSDQGRNGSAKEEKSLVPLTVGPSRSLSGEEVSLVVIFQSDRQIEIGWNSLKKLKEYPNVYLVRTAHILVRRADAERLFPAWVDRVDRGKLLCFHLAGAGADTLARKMKEREVGGIWISEGNGEKDVQGLFGLSEMAMGF